MFQLYSIQHAGITSNSGTSRHRGVPHSETESEWKAVMIFAQAPEGIVSVLREPLRAGGGHTQVHTLRCPQWGECGCQRLLQVPDPQLHPGNPSKAARVRPWFLPEKWLLLLHILQCLGNVVPEAPFLTLHFPNLSLILNCDDRSPNSFTAQPQVCLGGNSMSGCPSLSGHCVSLLVHHSSLGCTAKIQLCWDLALMLWIHYSKLP